jgi:hypothetical protein
LNRHCQQEAEQDPDQCPDGRHRGGLHEELVLDIDLAGAEGPQQSDLPGSFKHRGQHDVHDADPPDEQGDAGYGGHDDGEDLLRLLLLLQQGRRHHQLIVIFSTMAPGQQVIHGLSRLLRTGAIVQAQPDCIQFAFQGLET